jgi:hypothetical protein
MNRPWSLLAVVLAGLLVGAPNPALAKAPKLPVAKNKWDLVPLSRVFGLRLDTMKYDGKGKVTMTIAFTKKVTGARLLLLKGGLKGGLNYFHFYEGKVRVPKTNDYTTRGITGRKGDAIRLVLTLPAKVDFTKVTRVKVIGVARDEPRARLLLKYILAVQDNKLRLAQDLFDQIIKLKSRKR